MLSALCNSTVQHNRSFIQTSFCRLSVYSWEGRRALSYTKSYILINFMVHLHYYQSPIQISIRDSIVHGRMFHYLICISIDLRGTICTSICQSRARNTTPDYETKKKTLVAWPSWLIENRAWLYLAAYIRRKKTFSVCLFNSNKLISATYHIELVHVLTIGWNEKLIKLYKLRMTLFRYNKIKTPM